MSNGLVAEAEQRRLAALAAYAVLDTPGEPGFDDIVRIASQICGTPMALISLVDDRRQWFKAAIGVDVSETPREIAFCAHAIAQDGVLEVGDAAADPRFAENPLVTGDPNLRFYAGAPLLTSDGLALGTICVLDHKPRQLSADQSEALEALARQVMVQLDLRRAVARLHDADAHRQVLVEELRHRIRNTLALVQGIVSQTLRTSPSPDTARHAIDLRLVAMAKAYDALMDADWGPTTIDAIVAACELFVAQPEQVTRSGPPVVLVPRAALALAMAIHELSTNALKYGALSVPTGLVSIDWTIDDSAEDPVLQLVWRESGGPVVTPPARSGFGSQLLTRVLPHDLGGRAVTDHAPGGVRWTLTTALSRIS